MNKIRFWILALSAALALFSPIELRAQGLVNGPIHPSESEPPYTDKRSHGPYEHMVQSMLTRSLVSSGKVDHPCIMNFSVRGDGTVAANEVYVQQSSGSLDDDFACFDAIMSNCPYKSPLPPSQNQVVTLSFYKAVDGLDYAVVKSDAVTRTRNRAVVRIIPPSVAQHFPGLYSSTDLNSPSNLKVLRRDVFDRTKVMKDYFFPACVKNKLLIQRYTDWSNFIRKKPRASKKEIEAQQKIIDSRCAEIFED